MKLYFLRWSGTYFVIIYIIINIYSVHLFCCCLSSANTNNTLPFCLFSSDWLIYFFCLIGWFYVILIGWLTACFCVPLDLVYRLLFLLKYIDAVFGHCLIYCLFILLTKYITYVRESLKSRNFLRVKNLNKVYLCIALFKHFLE